MVMHLMCGKLGNYGAYWGEKRGKRHSMVSCKCPKLTGCGSEISDSAGSKIDYDDSAHYICSRKAFGSTIEHVDEGKPGCRLTDSDIQWSNSVNTSHLLALFSRQNSCTLAKP